MIREWVEDIMREAIIRDAGGLKQRLWEFELRNSQGMANAMHEQRKAEIVAEIVARNRRLLPCPYKRP